MYLYILFQQEKMSGNLRGNSRGVSSYVDRFQGSMKRLLLFQVHTVSDQRKRGLGVLQEQPDNDVLMCV